MDDFFRSLFGFNRPGHNIPNLGDEGDDHEDFSVFGGVEGDPFKDSFFHFETHIQKQMEAMSRQMEEMFKNFGAVEFPSEFDQGQGRALPGNPRDSMLKGSEPGGSDQVPSRDMIPMLPKVGPPSRFGRFRGFPRDETEEKKDTDLDSEIRGQKDLGRLFDSDKISPQFPQVPQLPQKSWFWNQGSSRSYSRTYMNGHVQEEETIKHPDGTTEKIVTEKHGDKSHTTRYITDKHGNTEKSESFQNMDEKSPSFGESWPQGRQPMIKEPESDLSIPGLSQDDKSFFKKLFGFDFWKSK